MESKKTFYAQKICAEMRIKMTYLEEYKEGNKFSDLSL